MPDSGQAPGSVGQNIPSHTSHVDSEGALASKGNREASALEAAGTRFEDALTHAGQRRINVLWEVTQSVVAMLVIGSVCGIAFRNAWVGENTDIPEVLKYLAVAIAATYFQRTNHEKRGGVGVQPCLPGEGYGGR